MAEKKDQTNKGIQGEGNYEATRNFDRAQENFVKSHRDEIPKKSQEAKRALEGKEGEDLRAAEERAKARSHYKDNER
jgi:hypothetical protein